MKIHLFSLDVPDPENRVPTPEYVPDEGKAFVGERVLVDNHQFRNCSFERCVLIYSGGPFGFDGCDIDNATELSLTGPAMRAALLWGYLQKRSRIP